MFTRDGAAALLGITLAIAATTASAAPLTYDFTGRLDSIVRNPFTGVIIVPIDTVATGSIVYDASVPELLDPFGDPYFGGAVTGFTLSMGAFSFVLKSAQLVDARVVNDPFFADMLQIGIYPAQATVVDLPGRWTTGLNLYLVDDTQTAIDTSSVLPPLTTPGFGLRNIRVGQTRAFDTSGTSDFDFYLTDLAFTLRPAEATVSAPATILLLAVGAGVLAWIRRRPAA